MPIRVTTWNVNGIRNPFKYAPWNKDRTLQSMFNLLEADIVCFQEVKTPKATMSDDLVFVDGWDAFYSFPHSQTGYSGVAVFTRDRKCSPVRVEEGVTGLLRVPGTHTSYVDLPSTDQIGGYPTEKQLRRAAVPRDAIDTEGRCLILEFPLLVLINVYCPARRNDERTGYRNAFLRALDARVRNLAAAGRNVVVCGDLNIARDQRDYPGIWSPHDGTQRLAEALTFDEGPMRTWSTQMLNRLLFGSRLVSDAGIPFGSATGRPPPVLHDTGRERHPERVGMFTCWDTRKNHRPANFGSRIDFILCSPKLMQLVDDADIQPQLHGSDHCPVYVVFRDCIAAGSTSTSTGTSDTIHILDYLNPPGRCVGGQIVPPDGDTTPPLRKYLPQSARRLPQFSNRRHVANMFRRAASATAPPDPTAAAEGAAPSPATADSLANAKHVQWDLPDLLRADPVETTSFSDDDADDDDDLDELEEDAGEEDVAIPQEGEKRTPAAVPDRISFFGGRQGKEEPNVSRVADEEASVPDAEGRGQSQPRSFFSTSRASSFASTPSPSKTASTSGRTLIRSRSATASSTTATAAVRPAKKAKTTKTTKTTKIAKTAKTAKTTTGIQTSMNMFLLQGSESRRASQPQPAPQPDPVPPLIQSEPPEAVGTEAAPSGTDSDGPATEENAAAAPNTNDTNTDKDPNEDDDGFDAVELVRNMEDARATWSRLGLGQRQAPLCEHGEPCKTFVTKKAGVNSGRSFFMCARPPGPLGRREKGTPWQCTTFVWCRDWKPSDQVA